MQHQDPILAQLFNELKFNFQNKKPVFSAENIDRYLNNFKRNIVEELAELELQSPDDDLSAMSIETLLIFITLHYNNASNAAFEKIIPLMHLILDSLNLEELEEIYQTFSHPDFLLQLYYFGIKNHVSTKEFSSKGFYNKAANYTYSNHFSQINFLLAKINAEKERKKNTPELLLKTLLSLNDGEQLKVYWQENFPKIAPFIWQLSFNDAPEKCSLVALLRGLLSKSDVDKKILQHILVQIMMCSSKSNLDQLKKYDIFYLGWINARKTLEQFCFNIRTMEPCELEFFFIRHQSILSRTLVFLPITTNYLTDETARYPMQFSLAEILFNLLIACLKTIHIAAYQRIIEKILIECHPETYVLIKENMEANLKRDLAIKHYINNFISHKPSADTLRQKNELFISILENVASKAFTDKTPTAMEAASTEDHTDGFSKISTNLIFEHLDIKRQSIVELVCESAPITMQTEAQQKDALETQQMDHALSETNSDETEFNWQSYLNLDEVTEDPAPQFVGTPSCST